MLFHRRRNRFRFTEKVHSKKGISALIISAVCWVALIIFLVLAFKGEGNLSPYYGSAGVFVTLISLVAFVLALRSTREEDSFQFFPRIALVVSFLSSASWIGIYILGLI